MNRQVLVVGLITVSLLSSFLIGCSRREVAGDDYITKEWDSIIKMADEGLQMREESKDLPIISLFSKSKRSQNKAIARHLQAGRRLLLSSDACKILSKCDNIEREMLKTSQKIEKLRAQAVIQPAKARKLNRKAKKLESSLKKLEKSRQRYQLEVAKKIRAVGLPVEDAMIGAFLSNVGANTLIDNAIVASNIRATVERLQTLMASDNIETSRRYFGMYIVLVDIQLACFNHFLEENKGKWIAGVDEILKDAREAEKIATRNSTDESFTAEQQEVFKANIRASKAVIGAAEAYRRMLLEQADAVKQKLEMTLKIRETAQNSYDTVRVARDFAELIRSGNNSFEAVISMSLPPIAIPSDSNMIREFENIARRLKERN